MEQQNYVDPLELKQTIIQDATSTATGTADPVQFQLNLPQGSYHQELSTLDFVLSEIAGGRTDFIDINLNKYFKDSLCTVFLNGEIILQTASFADYIYAQMQKDSKYNQYKPPVTFEANATTQKTAIQYYMKQTGGTVDVNKTGLTLSLPLRLLGLQSYSEFFTVPQQCIIQIQKQGAIAGLNLLTGLTLASPSVNSTASFKFQATLYSKSQLEQIKFMDYIIQKKMTFSGNGATLQDRQAFSQNQLCYLRAIQCNVAGANLVVNNALQKITIGNQLYFQDQNATGYKYWDLTNRQNFGNNENPFNPVLFLDKKYQNQLLQTEFQANSTGALYLTYYTAKI